MNKWDQITKANEEKQIIYRDLRVTKGLKLSDKEEVTLIRMFKKIEKLRMSSEKL